MTNPPPRAVGLEQSYRAEREAALLYSALAEIEPNATRRRVLERLAADEMGHADHWSDQLERTGQAVPHCDLSPGSRLLVWLATRFGTRAIAPLLSRREAREASLYLTSDRHPEMRLEERRHAQVVRALGRGDPQPLAADPWSESDGFNLRAAIFGVNDGLVSNLSLTAGLAGAQVGLHMIVVGGAAGLLAGALSMAGGEYLSVRSQQELMARQLQLRQSELEAAPAHAARLLAATYQLRGLAADEATHLASAHVASRIAMSHPEIAGLGSPVTAAVSSFAAFAAGAAIPLLPYLFSDQLGLPLSVAVSGVALAGVGALLGRMSGRSSAFSAGRMLGVGGLAAAVTYAAGRIFDVRA